MNLKKKSPILSWANGGQTCPREPGHSRDIAFIFSKRKYLIPRRLHYYLLFPPPHSQLIKA